MADNPDAAAVWSRDEIESPCVRVCVLHRESGLCLGCARTADEIAAWSRISPEERRRIMAELPSRSVPAVRRGGARRRRAGGADTT